MSRDGKRVEEGLLFHPMRLVDGTALSDDPPLADRTGTYSISFARWHPQG